MLVPITACGSSGSSSNGEDGNSTTTVEATSTTVGADDMQACTLFADTVGLAGLVPKQSDSWRDERERIIVDARREAELLRKVSVSVPPDVVVAFETVATYAEFVADAMDGSSSYEDANRRLEAFGDLGEVRVRDAEIDAWHDSHC